MEASPIAAQLNSTLITHSLSPTGTHHLIAMLSLLTKIAILATMVAAQDRPQGALTPKFVALIHAAGSPDKCITVRNSVLENGTPIEV